MFYVIFSLTDDVRVDMGKAVGSFYDKMRLGVSDILYNVKFSVSSVVLVNLLGYYKGPIFTGQFFTIKNVTAFIGPVLSFFESNMTLALNKGRTDVSRITKKWSLIGLLIIFVMSLVIWIMSDDIFKILSIPINAENSMLLLILLLAVVFELGVKVNNIILRNQNKTRLINRLGWFALTASISVYSLLLGTSINVGMIFISLQCSIFLFSLFQVKTKYDA